MSRSRKVYDDHEFDTVEQNLTDYEEFSLGKLSVDLYTKDIKYDHRMREQFNSKINQMDTHNAKILLRIENYLVNESWNKIRYDDNDCVNLLYLYLSKYTDPMQRFNDLVEYKTDNLLSDYYIKWFGSNLRRSLFVASLVEKYLIVKAYRGELELLEAISDYLRYKSPRFRFDSKFKLPKYQLVSYEDPEEDVKSRHIELVKATYLNNHVSNQDVKWIISSDADQIDWAYDYLDKIKEKQNKKDKSVNEDEDEEKINETDDDRHEESYIPLKRVFFPQTAREKYELILASIDRISNVEDPPYLTNASGSYSERGSILYKMEKAWRSRKTSADTILSSDEITVKLTKKNRDTLNKLGGNSNTEISKLINKFIEEYVKKTS